MSEQPWMPLYVGDYLRDTAHLTPEEHGCYLLLLMFMWARDGTIPDDDRDNARRLKLRPAKWLRIKARLSEFLIARDGILTQKRLQTERFSAHNRIQKWRENGAKGGRPRAKINDLEKGMGSTRARARRNSQSHPHTSPDGDVVTPKPKHGARLPEDWVLPLDDEAFALQQGMSRETVARTALKFKNYWLSRPKDAARLNWSKTWQNWVLTDIEGSKGNGHARQPKRTTADIAREFSDYARERSEEPLPPLRVLPRG